MIDQFKGKKIMVVVAHPDDELLGCGGTFHRIKKQLGSEIRVVILGEGLTSRSNQRDVEAWKKDLEIHRANIAAARACIGYDSTGIYGLPDNRFDTVALLDIVKIIEQEKQQFVPDVIFTHHGGDLNIDHQKTFEAVMTSSRPVAGETVKVIICFETPSSTEWQATLDPRVFAPNMVVSLSEEDLEAKTKGMECYSFEKRTFPHPRSPEALKLRAQYWGMTSGVKMGEAFQLVRFIS